jgi:hypothetical protein
MRGSHHRKDLVNTRASILVILLSLLTLGGCASQAPHDQTAATSRPASQPTSRPTASGLADEVGRRHGEEAWNAKQAVRARLKVQFGERPPLEGTLLYAMHTGESRLDLDGGTVLVFDGQKAWSAPGAFPRARFQLRTWPFFLSAPFKLGDPGSKLEPAGDHALQPAGQVLRCARLSFDAGVGDTPDDWYDCYVRDDGLLAGMGYIVTYGKSAAEAEKTPHAIVYRDYQEVDGVTLSTSWRFYSWTREGGITGDPLGSATLSKISFVTPEPGAFTKPEGAVEDALPE